MTPRGADESVHELLASLSSSTTTTEGSRGEQHAKEDKAAKRELAAARLLAVLEQSRGLQEPTAKRAK